MLHTPEKRARGSRGQAVLELALSLLVLLPILVGIADVGLYAYASIEVANAAHAGALYGAQNPATACDSAGMVAAAKADASDIGGISATASGSSSGCSANSLCACIANPQSSNSAPTLSACSTISCTAPSRVVPYVKVDTTATVNPLVQFAGFPPALTFRGESIMRVEQ